MSNSKRIISIVVIVFLLALLITLSYAYFASKISGNAAANNITVNTGNLSITYIDNSINESNLLPGWSTTKTITIKNTGTKAVNYELYWKSLTNNFVDKNDLIYNVKLSTTSGEVLYEFATTVPSNAEVFDSYSIPIGETYTYAITFEFLEDNTDQSDNIGASFAGEIFIR